MWRGNVAEAKQRGRTEKITGVGLVYKVTFNGGKWIKWRRGCIGAGDFDDVDLADLSSFGSEAEGQQEGRQVRQGVNPIKQRGKSKIQKDSLFRTVVRQGATEAQNSKVKHLR